MACVSASRCWPRTWPLTSCPRLAQNSPQRPYVRLSLWCRSPAAGPNPKRGTPDELFVTVEVGGPVPYRQYCDTFPARDLDNAPTSHFHGPLAIVPEATAVGGDPSLVLTRWAGENDLRAVVSTRDAGRGCWVVVKSHEGPEECSFPAGVRPVADVEFPPKVAGAPPVKRRFPLDRFC